MTTKTMTKQELCDLYQNLASLDGLIGVKFAYGVARNKEILKPEVDAINKAIEPSKEYSKYDDGRVKIAESYAQKDANGKPVIQFGQYQLEEKKKEAFEVAIAKYKKDNKKVIDARDKQVKDWEEMLKDSIKVKLHKIKLADVPENISVSQLNAIYSIIEE